MIKKIVSGIIEDPVTLFGMKVTDLSLRETPEFNGETNFVVGSPVLVKRNLDTRQRHFTFQEYEADIYLTETLQHKLVLAGLSPEGAVS